jgi:hypothetical protein
VRLKKERRGTPPYYSPAVIVIEAGCRRPSLSQRPVWPPIRIYIIFWYLHSYHYIARVPVPISYKVVDSFAIVSGLDAVPELIRGPEHDVAAIGRLSP